MNIEDMLTLLDHFNKSSLSELSFRQDSTEFVLKKGGEPVMPAVSRTEPAAAAPHHHVQAPAEQPAAAAATSADVITSPIVGTFYRSAAPDAPAFAEEGTVVKEGDTLCIIEAMKVMNELEAEFACEILSVLVENGAMVEYGTPIFEVKRA